MIGLLSFERVIGMMREMVFDQTGKSFDELLFIVSNDKNVRFSDGSGFKYKVTKLIRQSRKDPILIEKEIVQVIEQDLTRLN